MVMPSGGAPSDAGLFCGLGNLGFDSLFVWILK